MVLFKKENEREIYGEINLSRYSASFFAREQNLKTMVTSLNNIIFTCLILLSIYDQ